MRLPSQSPKKTNAILVAILLSALLSLTSPWAFARQAKFGPYAIPITQKTDFLRKTAAFDYWKFSQFYLPQQTSSACGLATTAMALNFLIGVPKYWDQTLITQSALLQSIFTGAWADKVAEGGDGLRLSELVSLIKDGLKFYKLKAYSVEVIRPEEGLARIQQVLADNEANANDLVLAYYNQGVLTSDWDGPHISPIGAYDAATRQVLFMDVDREWYPPYWSPVDKLLEAMLRPAPADQGILAGETGALIRIY